jgi:hypothetical protein
MAALFEGRVEPTLVSILRLIGGPGCRLNRRKQHPGTDQLLLEGLDWQLTLTSCVWGRGLQALRSLYPYKY